MLAMQKHSSLLCRIISLAYPQLKILAKAEFSPWTNTLAYCVALFVCLPSIENIRLSRKCFNWENTLAYFAYKISNSTHVGLPLMANIRLGRKCSTWTNTLAYFAARSVTLLMLTHP
jgi:hypothetical protein